jgi:hypothetical protein
VTGLRSAIRNEIKLSWRMSFSVSLAMVCVRSGASRG